MFIALSCVFLSGCLDNQAQERAAQLGQQIAEINAQRTKDKDLIKQAEARASELEGKIEEVDKALEEKEAAIKELQGRLESAQKEYEAYQANYKAVVRKNAEGERLATLTTKKGEEFFDVVVNRIDGVYLHILHRNGGARIPLADLEPALAERLGYPADVAVPK